MISQKFAKASVNRIICVIDNTMNDMNETTSDRMLDSIDSLSDLWVLANIKETYDKETVLSHRAHYLYDNGHSSH